MTLGAFVTSNESLSTFVEMFCFDWPEVELLRTGDMYDLDHDASACWGIH